jgi:predicted transposase YdaD
MLAEKREMMRMDISASIKNATLIGLEQGLVKGRAEGEARGRAEQAAITARNTLRKDLPIEDIMDITGLSRHEIEKLQ